MFYMNEWYIDHAHLEWHYIYAPISTQDYSFLVCHRVLSNSRLVLNNFQMQDPSSWQHLHTNPRIDLFYQFFRWQSVKEMPTKNTMRTHKWMYSHTRSSAQLKGQRSHTNTHTNTLRNYRCMTNGNDLRATPMQIFSIRNLFIWSSSFLISCDIAKWLSIFCFVCTKI